MNNTKARKSMLLLASPIVSKLRPANVAMFHFGRVGSTVLCNMLDQHSKIAWEGELKERFKKISHFYNEENPLIFLRLRMASAKLNIFGFETKINADLKITGLDLETYINYLINLGFNKFIILERKNLLRKIISEHVGIKRKQWHNYIPNKKTEINDKESNQIPQIKLDIEPITEWFKFGSDSKNIFESIEYLEGVHNKIRALLDDKYEVLNLTYEDDILENPFYAYNHVCEFLNLSPESPKINMRRINTYPLEEILLNYDEVVSAFKNTRYEWMLSSD